MKKFIKYLGITFIISTIAFFLILVLGQEFLDRPNFSSNQFLLKDIVIYIVYILQLVVNGVLSWFLYKLTVEKDSNEKRSYKIQSLKYIKNEIKYNKSIIHVLKCKHISIDKVNKHILKMDAWNKYSILLIDILKPDEYNKLLSYYSTINLYGIRELENDIISTIEENRELENILDNNIKKQ
ncbi:hypothetical protein AB2T96_17960 [Clostridium butyricum]|uniref:hypothetical protein n=1 Tax=Clostridium butyricum TaxID=1492 RepID=UPI003466C5DF